MNDRQHNELEAWAARELQSLPQRRAPEELLARVRRAIASGQRAPEPRPAVAWPPAWRLMAASVCSVSLVFFVWFAANSAAFAELTTSLRNLFASSAESLGGARALLEAALLLIRKIGHPALLTALLLFAALGAFCAAVGTACFRFVTAEKEI